MKKIIGISAIILSIFCISTVSSCEKYILPELKLLQDTLWAEAMGEEFRVGVVCNTIWNISNPTEAAWISFDTTDETVIVVVVDENTDAEEREHTIIVKTETLQKTIVVIQDGKEEDDETTGL
ncbi:MAG: BACON domain-containing protein [Bacteroidales bacterium]|nr:BACON domain-containing protein [Bacteroidales bacterium]